MRRALAALTVAVSASPPGSAATRQAARDTLALLDWTRFRLAVGSLNVGVYVSDDMPRGYVLSDGLGRLLVHPVSYPMMSGLQLTVLAPVSARPGVRPIERLLMPVLLAALAK